jgi:hypothetical protein
MNTNLANVTKFETSSESPGPKISCCHCAGSGCRALILLLIFELCLLHFRAHAVLPEPDNVLFGSIALDGRPITSADFDVVIEARRTPTGRAISSYQMGSQLRFGNFYSLRIPLESLTPRTATNSTLTGDVVYIVISDLNGERETRTLTVGARGTMLRLDIGSAVPDSDSDGLPDVWELAAFGNLGQNGNGDADGDGSTNQKEFLAGTNPNDGNDFFHLTIDQSPPAGRSVSFFATTAAGPGYAGYDRIYSLESTTNFALGTWRGVSNYTNVIGNNTTVTYLSNEPDIQTFYRCRLQLRNR